MATTVSFYNVKNDKVVDENIIKTIVGTNATDLTSIKKEAVKIFKNRHNKVISGTLIRVDKEDNNGCTLNEYYIYYDGMRFNRKFNLFWDVKEIAEFLGGNRYEPVQNLCEL